MFRFCSGFLPLPLLICAINLPFYLHFGCIDASLSRVTGMINLHNCFQHECSFREFIFLTRRLLRRCRNLWAFNRKLWDKMFRIGGAIDFWWPKEPPSRAAVQLVVMGDWETSGQTSLLWKHLPVESPGWATQI